MSESVESLLRIEKVCDRVGLGRTEVYVRMKAGTFPKRIKVGRLSVWVESEVSAWIGAQIKEARQLSKPK